MRLLIKLILFIFAITLTAGVSSYFSLDYASVLAGCALWFGLEALVEAVEARDGN